LLLLGESKSALDVLLGMPSAGRCHDAII